MVFAVFTKGRILTETLAECSISVLKTWGVKMHPSGIAKFYQKPVTRQYFLPYHPPAQRDTLA
jgi:hypothetical protein